MALCLPPSLSFCLSVFLSLFELLKVSQQSDESRATTHRWPSFYGPLRPSVPLSLCPSVPLSLCLCVPLSMSLTLWLVAPLALSLSLGLFV
eukprot:COSAG02_NODE_1622_length_11607_cov_6.986097_3_plen_91_part_00